MKHWQLTTDEQGIAWLTFDQAETTVNTLDPETLAELDSALGAIEAAAPAGLLIRSAKPTGFIAGADVRGFAGLTDQTAAADLIRRVHAILDRLECLPCPSVALIQGHCLGGGLELALACTYRVAAEGPATTLGFPEVRLGIFPGFGGSARSLQRVGHLAAMDLMLSGHNLSGRAAKAIGLVDDCVAPRQLTAAALWFLGHRPARRRPSLVQRAAAWPGVRGLVARRMRKRVSGEVDPAHYPAPHALIDHWERHAGNPAALYANEAVAVPRLLAGDTAQNLVRLFLLRERLRGAGEGGEGETPHLHVVGAGVMGGDIAAWAALRGLRVSLQDRRPQDLTRAMQRAGDLFTRRLKDPRLIRDARDRLIPDARGDGVGHADVVLEAIVEDLDAKRALFAHLAPCLKPGALLATNTSSIPLEALGAALDAPGLLVGLHFFNPVERMPLVEVVRGAATHATTIARALALARRLDKVPLVVKSGPGFLVNRVLMPYLLEAVALVEEGVAPATVDRAATAFGMPMGPIALADTVGLDICLAVAGRMTDPASIPASLSRHVAAGHLGRKTGQGYYRWQGGRAQPGAIARDPTREEQDRLLLRLANEAVACLREGVAEDADALDAGLVFGAGFAPFRGGPLRHIQAEGAAVVVARLSALHQCFGERFKPDVGWASLMGEPSC
ncbi:MAG: enoyl-CoA hydratase/isomerase family protein [Chromatiaceae bacterium]|nr:enoyl-CoA hydratase/isomerase family protein [Chromatiaceae bacterium]